MQDELKLYINISEDMITALNNEDYDLFDTFLDKRQAIIYSIEDKDLIAKFRKLYNDEEVFKMDIQIKQTLEYILDDTKREIREYKSKIQGNNIYSSIKKENFNIFYKKV